MIVKLKTAFFIVLFYCYLALAEIKPNVILLFSDDAGYADFGFHGTNQLKTPRLDEMAKNGITFTNGYVSGCVCHPSRAGLLTGRNQVRYGHHYNPGNNAEEELPRNEVTIAEQLKKVDYKTMLVGKWHLGRSYSHPNKRGFDEFYGILNGNSDYFKAKGLEYNGVPVNNHPYLTDAFAQKAVEFIEHSQHDPFFLYASFTAVHTPDQAKDDQLAHFNHISNKTRRTVAAMTYALDSACGEIIDKVEELGLSEKTLIFFINDNGGANQHRKNNPFSGIKGTHLDGGVRVPFLAQWKGTLSQGVKYEYPVSTLDFFATVSALAAIPLPSDRPYDGINLIPFITGVNKKRPQKYLHWDKWFRGMRYLDYKLITLTSDRAPCLYDLSKDPAEENNLATKLPGLTTTLLKYMDKWFQDSAIEPLFEEDSVWFHRTLKDYGNRGLGVNFVPKDTNLVLEKETVPESTAVVPIKETKRDNIFILADSRGGIRVQLPSFVPLPLQGEIYTLAARRLNKITLRPKRGWYYGRNNSRKYSSLASGMYLIKISTPQGLLYSSLFQIQ